MHRARFAITAVFALNGSLFATFSARLPAIQERTGISEGQLGLALLCAMIGLLSVQLVAGALVSRFGSRPVVLGGALGYALGLMPVALSTSFGALAASMFLIGVASGPLDVAMNVHGLTIERRIERPILSGLHAAFSFGALAGAAAGGLVADAGVGVVSHFAVVAAAGATLALVLRALLLPPGADAAPEGPRFARPTRALALVGVFAICAVLAEGAVSNWSAVYLEGEVGAGEGTAAASLAAFSLGMGIGRLTGDRLSALLGTVRLARGGASLAAVAIGIALLADSPLIAIAGFALAGVGLAALFPLALRAAAERGDSAGPAVAAVSAMAYVGFIAGPPAIGGLAELVGLRAALALVVACLAAAAVLADAVRTPAAARSR
ncbi:MAG TPA: MFS transporter [Thermoleophilaceae bacterium]|nr:MFS transporter [Thermoleophilaceae bacterium]